MKPLFLGAGALFLFAGIHLIQVDAGMSFFALLTFAAYLTMTFLWSRLETDTK